MQGAELRRCAAHGSVFEPGRVCISMAPAFVTEQSKSPSFGGLGPAEKESSSVGSVARDIAVEVVGFGDTD